MNKKGYLQSIGKILVEENGKQEFYKAEQIDKAHKKVKEEVITDSVFDALELLEIAYSLYSPVDDFVSKFSSNAARYLELKTEAIKNIYDSSSFDSESLSDIDIDSSWLEVDDIFEGITAFFEGIFEALS